MAQTARQVTVSMEQRTAFPDTAARLCIYPFTDCFTLRFVKSVDEMASEHEKIRQASKAIKALKILEKSATGTVADLVELRGIEHLSKHPQTLGISGFLNLLDVLLDVFFGGFFSCF